MASTTFSGPVTSSDGFVGLITLTNYTVASAPSAATAGAGTIAYISNGAGGDPILAYSDGTNWKRTDTRATISAS